MPDQHVTDYEQAELRSEGDVLVRGRELEAIGLRMDGVPLQDVLRTDRVAVAPDDFERHRVLAGNLGVVERDSEEKTPLQDIPEGGAHGQAPASLSTRLRRSASSSWICRFRFFPIE